MQMTTQCDCVSSAHVLPILTTHGIQLCKPREASLGTHAMPAAAHLDPQATTERYIKSAVSTTHHHQAEAPPPATMEACMHVHYRSRPH